jgi:hypothetical protein
VSREGALGLNKGIGLKKKSEVMINPKTHEKLEVYNGFSVPAFLLTPIWCAIKSLYLQAIISILLAFTGVGFIYWIVAGVKGNEWYRDSLIKKGYVSENSYEESPAVETETSDSFSKLDKLKKLLDSGAISQEEYDEKRKRYLEDL